MYRTISIIALCAWASSAQAHEMIPTYPKLNYSHLSGVVKTSVQLFNKREEIEFYEIGVFDTDFNPIPFATSSRVVRLPHLQRVTLEIYIRESDRDAALYICSESKLRKGDEVKTRIASRICSKIKK